MKISIIDIDETIYPLEKTVEKFIKEEFNGEYNKYLKVRKENNHIYKFSDLLEVGKNQIPELNEFGAKNLLRGVGDKHYFQTIKPYKGSKKLLDVAKRNSDQVIILSTRGKEDNEDYYYTNAMEKTIMWMDVNKLKFNEIIFSNDKKSVIQEYLSNNTKINFVIDDAPEQVEKMLELKENIPIMMPEKRYNSQFLTENQHYENLIRVNDINFATSMAKILSSN